MFYSQFILAKKGPLGTIWIAAHLERKLRKNQVADTDIGVSVDSILFPEVPIALRLSSHLLLGVVRIYSRKVNYLFHDCSEALLKIKQAFRSTAVDLPPEESTAPYHSITLPETFDLDDFELPDFGFSHGNYVDHHISTREQITLQDTMDDMVYSTSQFGLDERFGDGDASQFALDFDEDLLLDKVHSPAHTSVLLGSKDDVVEQIHDQMKSPSDSMELDEHPCGLTVRRSSGSAEETEQFPSLSCDMQADLDSLNPDGGNGSAVPVGIEIRTPELIKESVPCVLVQEQVPDSEENKIAYPDVQSASAIHNEEDHPFTAQAPSTPGLMEEVVPANVQELPSFGTLRKHSFSYAGDPVLDGSDNSKCDNEESDGEPGNSIKVKSVVAEPPAELLDSSVLNDVHHNEVLMPMDQVSDSVQILDTGTGGPHGLQSPNCMPDAITIAESSNPQDLISADVTRQEVLTDATTADHVRCEDCSAPQHAASAEADNSTCACSHVLRACNANPQKDYSLNMQDGLSEEQPTCLLNKVVENGDHDLLGNEKSLHEVTLGSLAVEHPAPNCVASDSAELHDREMGSTLGKTSEVEHWHGEGCSLMEITEPNIASQQKSGSTRSGEEMANSTGSGHFVAVQSIDGPSDDPLLEKLCSAPPEVSDLQEDFVANDSSVFDASLVSGKTSIDAGETVLGKRQNSMDSTPVLPDRNPSKISKLSESARSVNFIPDDDDLLASILVGRRTPIFKIKSTPPAAEIVSSRRPRAAVKAGAQKRKVLLDDTMVLHGDAIRQQLTSTEDIRRVRRKAPCTTPEIWRIEKLASADEIFIEPLLTGMCPQLASLYSKTLWLTGIGSAISTHAEPAASSDLIKEPIAQHVETLRNSSENNYPQVPESVDTLVVPEDSLSHSREVGAQGPTETIIQEPEKCATLVDGVTSEAAVQDGRNNDSPMTDRPDEPAVSGMLGPTISEHHIQNNVVDGLTSVDGISQVDPSHSDKGSSDNRVEVNTIENHSDSCLRISDEDLVQPVDKTLEAHNGNLYTSSLVDGAPIKGDVSSINSTEDKHGAADYSKNEVTEKHDILGEETVETDASKSPLESDLQLQRLENGDVSSPMLPTCPQLGFSVPNGNGILNSDVPAGSNDRSMLANGHDEYASTRTQSDSVVSTKDKATSELVGFDNKASEHEDLHNAASYPLLQSDAQLVSLHIEDDADHVSNGEPLQDVQHTNQHSAEDFSAGIGLDANSMEGFPYEAAASNIEFLNVDDEQEPEEDGMDVSTAAHDQVEENSGWSIRTRGVAKYLKSLFESIELNSGKIGLAAQRTVPLDRLLVGKTRKEASRMFFETLVLNTRDYIHVEQQRPFDNIDVGPKVKLMKSEF